MRRHRAGHGPEPPNPARPRRSGIAGACSGFQIRRPSTALSAGRMNAREGVELKRSSLADWVGASTELLAPLTDGLPRYVMSVRKLHADDTPVPV